MKNILSNSKKYYLQLEEAEYNRAAAVKAKQSKELELGELQSQLEDTGRGRKLAEDKAAKVRGMAVQIFSATLTNIFPAAGPGQVGAERAAAGERGGACGGDPQVQEQRVDHQPGPAHHPEPGAARAGQQAVVKLLTEFRGSFHKILKRNLVPLVEILQTAPQ